MELRTLTGKKVYLTKEQREEMVEKCQTARDAWEDKHLGNF